MNLTEEIKKTQAYLEALQQVESIDHSKRMAVMRGEQVYCIVPEQPHQTKRGDYRCHFLIALYDIATQEQLTWLIDGQTISQALKIIENLKANNA